MTKQPEMCDKMHDRQLKFKHVGPAPASDADPLIITGVLSCFGGGSYEIEVRGKIIRFDWSEQFGPLPINRDGSEARSIGPKHAFWRAASLWNLQGQRLDGKHAIWHEPQKPVYELTPATGRHRVITKVIHPGEPGHDW
jgi:hypothetical protein